MGGGLLVVGLPEVLMRVVDVLEMPHGFLSSYPQQGLYLSGW